ncbi:MAG: RNA methyltransferase [Promethearchaeota archaeon]
MNRENSGNTKSNGLISIILIEPEKPGNIGSIARVMKNFGFRDLILVNPQTEINEDAINYSVHAFDVLNDAKILRYPDPGDINAKTGFLQQLFSNYDVIVGTTCRIYNNKTLHRIPISIKDFFLDLKKICNLHEKRLGFVFGKESSGLPNFILQIIDILVTIPASDEYPSLNLSHSVAIFLYELSELLNNVRIKGNITLSSREKKDKLLEYCHHLVDIVNVPAHKSEKARKAFKSMIYRSHLSKREVTLMIGVFRRISEILKRAS